MITKQTEEIIWIKYVLMPWLTKEKKHAIAVLSSEFQVAHLILMVYPHIHLSA
jgi:hypothetical protein